MSSTEVLVHGGDGSTVRIDRFPAILGRYEEGAAGGVDCDLSGLDPEKKVSRRHASLDVQDGRLLVTDLGSSNGTTLDGNRLVANVPVAAGMHASLHVGPVELRLDVRGTGVASDPTPSAPTAPMQASPDIAFVNQVFRAFADPAITHLVIEPGRKVRLRRDGEWGQTGSTSVGVEAWNALWTHLCRLTSLDPAKGGYISTLSGEAVLVEVFRPLLTGHPVMIAQRRPAPAGLSNLVAAGVLDAPSAAGLQQVVARGEGVIVSGGARCGRTSMLEALIDEVPRGARIVIVERRPTIRSVSPQAIRIRSTGGQGEAAIEAALALSPDWIVVDDALPGAAAASTWLLPGGGAGLLFGARTGDVSAWRARAVDMLAAHGFDRAAAELDLVTHLPIDVAMAPHQGGFLVEHIARLQLEAPGQD
jgi:hypothetical protein